jgi:Ca2+-binding EF-hand superfamily protein
MGMTISNQQAVLGSRMIRMLKKHLKNKTSPSKEELIKLAKVLDKDVDDIKTAASLLTSEGIGTLKGCGVIPDTEVTQIVETITSQAGEFDNFTDFAQAMTEQLPIPAEAKFLAAAFLEGDE